MRALIVGGGIAGPALALLMKQASIGIEPVVYEAAKELRDVGAGLNLTPNGMRVLDALGLTERIKNAGQVTDTLQLVGPDGKIIVSTPFAGGQKLPAVSIRRHTLQTLLHQELHREGIRVEYGKRVASVVQGADACPRHNNKGECGEVDHAVHAVFQDGSSAEGDMLFGCDGVRSKTRDALFGRESPSYAGEVVYMALTSSAIPGLPRGTCRVFMGPGKHLGTYHVADDVTMWWALTQQAELSWETTDDLPGWGPLSQPRAIQQQLLIMFDDMPAVHNVIGQDINRVMMLGVYDRPVRGVLSSSTIALVGDAANPVSPHLGQGANKALEDAGVLVECLKHGLGSLQCELCKYQMLRSHRAQEIARWSAGSSSVRNVSNSLAVTLRDWSLKAIMGMGGKLPGSWLYAYDFRKAAAL